MTTMMNNNQTSTRDLCAQTQSFFAMARVRYFAYFYFYYYYFINFVKQPQRKLA